jgi:hypothetical protein
VEWAVRCATRCVVSREGISLAGELGLLRQALAAAAELLEPSIVGEELPPDAGREVLAVLSLAEARVELLRRAVVGAVDPSLLLARHNEVTDSLRTDDDPDIILKVWARRKAQPWAPPALTPAGTPRGAFTRDRVATRRTRHHRT